MTTRYVLTFCTVLVVGGAFMTGSAHARSKADEETSKKASAVSDRKSEKTVKGDRKAELAVEKTSKKESAASDRYFDKTARVATLTDARVSSASVAVPKASTLLLLGSCLAGLATWGFSWRKTGGHRVQSEI